LRQVSLGVSAIPAPRISPPLPRSGFVLKPIPVDRHCRGWDLIRLKIDDLCVGGGLRDRGYGQGAD
jgi:hypothetical protein